MQRGTGDLIKLLDTSNGTSTCELIKACKWAFQGGEQLPTQLHVCGDLSKF